METKNLKAHIFLTAFILGTLASVLVIVIIPQNSAAAAFAAGASLFCAILAFIQYKRLKAVRLILESQILHIQAAVLRNAAAAGAKGTDVYISCFGLLVDGRPVPFNQKSNRLRRVEIGRDYIALSWGTKTNIKSAKILHPFMDGAEVQKIAEYFRFETGVQPVLAGDGR